MKGNLGKILDHDWDTKPVQGESLLYSQAEYWFMRGVLAAHDLSSTLTTELIAQLREENDE